MSNSATAASGLRKAYGDKTVLGGIGLDVRAGTVFALLGPNGAGKTTAVDELLTGDENLQLMAGLKHLGAREGRRAVTGLLERLAASSQQAGTGRRGGWRAGPGTWCGKRPGHRPAASAGPRPAQT